MNDVLKKILDKFLKIGYKVLYLDGPDIRLVDILEEKMHIDICIIDGEFAYQKYYYTKESEKYLKFPDDKITSWIFDEEHRLINELHEYFLNNQ